MRSKSKMQRMRLGQTIVGERERAESESARMLARKKVHRRQTTSVLIVVLMLVILTLAFYLGVKEMTVAEIAPNGATEELKVQATVVDEDNRGQISSRVRNYIATLEQDLADLGLKVTKVTLPTGASRALYIDIVGQEAYYKVDIDRDAAVVAEDIQRMARYLAEQDLHPTYVDVRVEGKAYFK